MNDKRNILEVHQSSNGLGLQNKLKPEVVVLERGAYVLCYSVNVHIIAYCTLYLTRFLRLLNLPFPRLQKHVCVGPWNWHLDKNKKKD